MGAATAACDGHSRAEQRSGEHVGWIVHAEIQARDGQPGGEPVERRRG